MGSEKDKLVVLYGNNNVGKSTQLELLEKRLTGEGVLYKRLKYPIYDLEPTGPRILGVLKQGVEKMTTLELQGLYVSNRRDFEPQLISMLASGLLVIAEDYVGTGLAWGVVNGVELGVMEEMNRGLLAPDLALLLDGPRRHEAIEPGHLHEDGGNWEKSREVHLMLAQRYGWVVINGDQEKEKVGEEIFNILRQSL